MLYGRLWWAWYIACMGKQDAYKIFIVKPCGKRSSVRPRIILKWIPVVGNVHSLRLGCSGNCVYCDDCRGDCEDHWIEVPLLHSAVEPFWLPAGCSIHPRNLDGGHYDWLSGITYSPQGCTCLPYWTHPTPHKGEPEIKTCQIFCIAHDKMQKSISCIVSTINRREYVQ